MSTETGKGPTRYAVLGWSAIAGSTAAWATHLVFSGAWSVFGGRARAGPAASCSYGSVWPLHVATLVTGLACVLAFVAGAVVYRHRDGADSGEGTIAAQYRFLGLVGMGTAIINLVLILAEGSYVFFLRSCG